MKPPLAIAGFLAAALHAFVLFGLAGSKPAKPLPVAAESLEVELTAAPAEPLAVAEPPPESPPEPDLPLPEPEPEPVPEAPPAPAPLPMPEPVREMVEPPKPLPPPVKPPKPKAKPTTAPAKSTTPLPAGSPTGIAKAPVQTTGLGTSKVRVRSNPAPNYPSAARQARQQGTVTVDVEVSTAGLPLTVSLARSSGFPALDQAALAAVRRWEFEPARTAGVAVKGHVVVPLRFVLK